MSDVMMMLGPYAFSIDNVTYQQLSQSRAWRWSQHERVGKRPVYHYVGPDEETITLTGTHYPQFNRKLDPMGDLAKQANQGKPLTMVDGRGRVLGQFIIRRVEMDVDVFFPKGVPRKMGFTIELTYHSPATTAVASVSARRSP